MMPSNSLRMHFLRLAVRSGLFRPGDDCSSLHGPRCQAVKHFFRANHAMQVFASQTKASSRVNIMDRISDLPIIKAIAETQLKLLLGEPLYKRVKATGQLSQQGTRYQVPQTVLPRYEVKGASVPGGQFMRFLALSPCADLTSAEGTDHSLPSALCSN
eukprot:SAG31_NODE_6699_length_1919_cov_2.099451_4_plen_158_part_00